MVIITIIILAKITVMPSQNAAGALYNTLISHVSNYICSYAICVSRVMS